MPLGRARLSQGTTPSSLAWQARWVDVRVEVAPIIRRESAPRQIDDETSIRSVQIPEPRGVGIVEGMGRDTGWPSMMGLGHPPAALSKPFRLKMIFTVTLVRFTASRGLVHRLGMPANSPSFAVHTTGIRSVRFCRHLIFSLSHSLSPKLDLAEGPRDP